MNKLLAGIGPGKVGERGSFASADYNAFQEKVLDFLAIVASEWNAILQPLIDSLPNGSRLVSLDDRSDEIDPVVNGFDGSQIYMDMTATEGTDGGLLYDSTQDRPFTIKETVLDIRDDLLDEVSRLDGIVAKFDTAGLLTEAQKIRIGYNVFDETKSSAPDSIDGRGIRNSRNIIEVAANVFNLDGAIGDPLQIPILGTGRQSILPTINDRLNAAEIEIAALLIKVWPQTQVAQSISINDSFAGFPSNLQDDLNQIRTAIKNTKGSTGWLALPTAPFAPGGVTVSSHINTHGTGVQDAQNPHGLDFADLDDVTGIIAAILAAIAANTNSATCALQRIGEAAPHTPPCAMNYGVTHYLQLETTLLGADIELDSQIFATNQAYQAADANLQAQIDTITTESRLLNCLSLEETDGFRTVFGIAMPIAGEDIPDSAGYDWPGNTLMAFQLQWDPVEYPGVYFSATTLFQTEIYGSLPSYPGEYLIIYDDSDIIQSGMEVGEVYVFTPPGIWDDISRGCVSYWTAFPWTYQSNSVEVFLDRQLGYRFVEWDEYPVCADAGKSQIIFTTAPTAGQTIALSLVIE